ncbi:hypothetical protein [Geovibrio sp. ADMFC3]
MRLAQRSKPEVSSGEAISKNSRTLVFATMPDKMKGTKNNIGFLESMGK